MRKVSPAWAARCSICRWAARACSRPIPYLLASTSTVGAVTPVGGRRVLDFGEAIGYGVPPMPDFWLGRQATGEGFRESHLAFTAPDRAAVHAFFEAATARGAEVLHRPRVWPEYHASYYGAFV